MSRNQGQTTISPQLASHFVEVEHLPWEQTAYAGVEQKTLLWSNRPTC